MLFAKDLFKKISKLSNVVSSLPKSLHAGESKLFPKIISSLICMCLVASMTIIAPPANTVKAAETSTFTISGSRLYKDVDSSISISVTNNKKRIAGVELFLAFDSDAISVKSVNSQLSSSWELDYKVCTFAKYGRGIHIMLQDSSLTGFNNTEKKFVSLNLDAGSATLNKNYNFKVYVIDVCDVNGNSTLANYSGSEQTLKCVDSSAKDIELLGLQYSTVNNGVRIISAVEPEINGKQVVEHGHVFGLVTTGVDESAMYVGNNSTGYVRTLKSTSVGDCEVNMSSSNTATTYVMTIVSNGSSVAALTQNYMVRAYAKLSDGTYVYSDVVTYNIYRLAGILYNNYRMPNEAAHNYLYNNILTVVDPNYKRVDYNYWSEFVS